METLELPVVETTEAETAPATCIEDDIDLTALKLWREASVPEALEETE
jgi:hypothetical protein